MLAYKSFPRDHWAKIHSTNPLKRLDKEIKRRTNVVDIFPDEAAVTRLVGALMLEQNDEWAITRRHMTLETVAAICDTAPITLTDSIEMSAFSVVLPEASPCVESVVTARAQKVSEPVEAVRNHHSARWPWDLRLGERCRSTSAAARPAHAMASATSAIGVRACRVGDAGVLDVEAAGLGVAEHAFDRPAFAIGGQRPARGDVGDDDQPFVAEALRGEGEERRVVSLRILARAETCLEEAGAPGSAEPGEQREIAAVLGRDPQVLAQADREGDIGIVEKFDPVGPDELSIREQQPDARSREMREIPPQQRDPGRGRAVARALEQRPDSGTSKRRVITASAR